MSYVFNLGQKFKQVASQYAGKTAVIAEEGSITYAELDERSDAIASELAGDVVLIPGHKRIETVAKIIAALKRGIVYSVYDPDSPQERLDKIFGQMRAGGSGAAGSRGAGRDTGAPVEAGAGEDPGAPSAGAPVAADASVRPTITAATPAYIMFTSGSTGIPKGAVMTHQNVLNLIAWSMEQYSFTPEDVLTNINPLFFDNSVFDLYSSLFSGATLALFTAETVRNPGKLMQLLDEWKCTSWFSVPSMLIFLQTMRAFKSTNLTHMKRIIFGGEGYPKAKLKELFDIYRDRIAFHNVYGPTECTCICSSYEVSAEDFADLKGFLPLGGLIPNFDYLIVDEELRPVPCGETGELVLRGPNVGLGYYNDPERTRVGFIQNPAHDAYEEKVYRTGDLVCLNPDDGKIWILGRADNQIKHMGYRIELEEIENALSCVDGVKQSAVVHCEIRGMSNIIAFLRTENNEQIEETELRGKLQKIIPQYMIPSRFHFMQELPKNANGKLDRKKLKTDYMVQVANG